MHGQPKLDALICKPFSYYSSASASEATSEHLIFEHVLGEHAPCPLVLHIYVLIHAYMYIHIRHPCNPPSENPDYGPAICGKVTWPLLIKYSYIARLRHPYIHSTNALVVCTQ